MEKHWNEIVEEQWNEDGTQVTYWEGPGWYAGRQEGDVVKDYHVGSDRDEQPDTYTMGLGTPQWYDK